MTLLALVPSSSAAATLRITPTLDLGSEEALARAQATEKTDFVFGGKGDRLRIVYTSPVRIDVDLAPRRRGAGFDPTEVLHFTLPPGAHTEAVIDLTQTPGWSPLEKEYHAYFASPPGGKDAEIETIDFLPWTLGTLLMTAARNLATRDTFQVSTFHALRGYNMLGFSLSIIIGATTILIALATLLRRTSRTRALAPVLVTGMLLYTAWFGVDLARFTTRNLREWYAEGLYNKAGAAEAVADAIQKEASASPTPLFVHVCHDTTDFYAKVLRYLLYPTPVSVRAEDVARATHVVVAGKLSWSFHDGTLTCGSVTGPARELATFRDGTVLYASIP